MHAAVLATQQFDHILRRQKAARWTPAAGGEDSDRHKCDAIEPCDALAGIEIASDELVLRMTAGVELATGSAVIQRRKELLTMLFEERNRGIGFR